MKTAIFLTFMSIAFILIAYGIFKLLIAVLPHNHRDVFDMIEKCNGKTYSICKYCSKIIEYDEIEERWK